MEYSTTALETLKLEHAHLNAVIKEEEGHVWKNLIRIEQLKREKLKKKDAILRRRIQCVKPI